MLQLYDTNHVKLEGLTKYKNYNIESILSTGDKVLSFSYPKKYSDNIEEEGYIRTKTAEFVIKEIGDAVDRITVKATLNIEGLEGHPWDRFDSTEQTITDCLNLALAGTGWSVGTCNVTKLRTVRKTGCSAWDIVQEAVKTYRVEMQFDTLNKKINIYDKLGSDKGCYFIDSLNLKALTIQRNSYDYYTRIQAVGKDGLTLPAPGYVENYQYSNKIKTLYWKDERYTDITSLTEDSNLKLEDLSKPYRAYSADIIDLANSSTKYKDILSYSLGDTITLISKDMKVKEKQRIAKITEYPDEPEKNTCELANVILSFENIQKENQDTTDTVNNITEDNGTVSQGAISQAVNNLTVQQFSAVTGRIGTLESTTAHITNGVIDNATIGVEHVNDLYANYAHISNGVLDNAMIGTEQVQNSAITNAKIANEAVGTSQIQLGAITQALIGNEAVGSSQIADASIGDGKIVNLSVAKLLAGDISTTKFRIVSDSGNMLMSDNTIQISDASRVRVQIGKDASADYNMYVWDASGNLMFDATGLKASGIKSKIIRDDMVSDTANINAAKIDINSLFSQMNGSTNTLKSSKIYLDTQAQTLDLAFTSLKNTVTSQGQTVTSQGTSIGVIQGQISSKIWSTDITTAVNNIQIGGRNLVYNSGFFANIEHWVIPTSAFTYEITTNKELAITKSLNVSVVHGNMSLTSTLTQGQSYIVSFYMKSTVSGIFSFALQQPNGTYCTHIIINFVEANTYYNFKILFTASSADALCNALGFSSTLMTLNQTITIKYAKLEQSTKATDWTPAPEDIQAQIDTHTTEISQNTTDISLKASQSSLDTLTGRMSTAEASITTNANNITLKASQSSLDTTDSNVSGLTTRMSSAESSITTNADNIALKVSTSDYTGNTIASLINQSATTVSIDASKINLSGYVTISALGTAGQTTINGSNITTGTLDASKISVINLNASNITSGTISANKISGGTLTGITITGATINAINTLTVGGQGSNWGQLNLTSALGHSGSIYANDQRGITIDSDDNIMLAPRTGSTFVSSSLFVLSQTICQGTVYPQLYGNGNYLHLAYNSGSNAGFVLQQSYTRLALNGSMNLGHPSYKWATVYASTGTINTSDRNEKNTIVPLSNAQSLDFIMSLNPVSYKLNDGTSGRTHYGMIAQDVEDEMATLGMTSLDFAGFIKSPKQTEVIDTNGNNTHELVDVPNEYNYALRYEEFISPLIKTVQVQQQKIIDLEARISILENKIA